MAPTATAMQCTSMIDICYNYGLDNEALLNPLKSIIILLCMLFKIKGYKLHRPNTMIGSELANSANETFCMQKVMNCYVFLTIAQLI